MKLHKKWKQSEEGNTLLITVIILLALSMMVTSGMILSSMHFDLAIFKRNTSNTYYLAKSAAEKQVEIMNQVVEMKVSQMINEDIVPYYTDQLVHNQVTIQYNQTNQKLEIQEDLTNYIKEELYNYLLASYAEEDIVYKIQSDRVESSSYTEVKIKVTNKDENGKKIEKQGLRVIATAITKNGQQIYDKQVVEALVYIQLPERIRNKIDEDYDWNEEIPDVLKSGILCYSDLVVSDEGILNVQGDIRVGGTPSLEGKLENESIIYPKVDQTGGIIAINGGQIHAKHNVYCTRNITATNGWYSEAYGKDTCINIEEDAIAYTIGIVDDFYEDGQNQTPYDSNHQGSHIQINIGRNGMVDNDVVIDPWVRESNIEVGQTIFGVGGNVSEMGNPNQSSGIFSRGPECKIKAEGMYVAGQAFVLTGLFNQPMRLWESIGEPFEDIALWEGYQEGQDIEMNRSYLEEESPLYSFIKTDKIETDFANTYAIAGVTGLDTHTQTYQIGASCKSVFGENEVEARDFFFQGQQNERYSLAEFMKDDEQYESYITQVDSIIQGQASSYLRGETDLSRRDLGEVRDCTYEGLKGYMTLMRSVLYRSNQEKNQASYLTEATFDDLINLEVLELEEHSWCYEDPIEVIPLDAKRARLFKIKIADYYVDEGEGMQPYPSLIINSHQEVTLKIEADEKQDTFRGWIISAGPVEIGEGVKIEGGLIVGGPQEGAKDQLEIYEGKYAGMIVKEGVVDIQYNPDLFLEVKVSKGALYRKVLDALYLTNYKEEILADIMAGQNANTKPALKYTKQSVLELDVKDIKATTQYLKTNIY